LRRRRLKEEEEEEEEEVEKADKIVCFHLLIGDEKKKT